MFTLSIAREVAVLVGAKGKTLARVPLRSERCALLLACLANAARRQEVVTMTAFSQALAAHGAKGIPDRRGMSLLVASASAALHALSDDNPDATPLHIDWPLRAATVGPWRLVHGSQLRCVVDPRLRDTLEPVDVGAAAARRAAMPAPPEAKPGIVLQPSAAATRQALERFIEADAASMQGDHQSAADALLQATEMRSTLTPEAHAAALLRQARFAKRLGLHDDAARCAVRALRSAARPGCRDAAALAGEARTLQARLAYDRDPTRATRHLWHTLDATPPWAPQPAARERSGRHEFDRSNLRALMARRRAVQHSADDVAGLAPACDLAWRCAVESLYWAWADNDPVNLQNGVANTAYTLHCLLRAHGAWTTSTLHCDADEVLRWYALALKACRVLKVGKETVWDGIFIAAHWLDQPPDRWTQPHAVLEREGVSPASLAFYEAMVRDSAGIGDLRQQALALQALWRFATHTRATAQVGRAARQLRGLPLSTRRLLRDEGYALPDGC